MNIAARAFPPTPALPPAQAAFARDLLAGLTARPRTIAPKYFYDAEGSALFDRICQLPEYYQTRTELRILQEHAGEIAAQIGQGAELLEFGAGSLTKVRILLDALDQGRALRRYVPIDISGEHLEAAAAELRTHYPDLAVQPLVADYMQPFPLPDGDADNAPRRAGFFPGSTIGNLQPEEALGFLRTTARLLKGGGLLIGVDLLKDPARLHAAYNDAQGVTAAFNLNVLRRANEELGADFDLGGFAHYALYNPALRRIEMHLVSRRAQRVTLCGQRIAFEEGDDIHTESSYKYSVESFRALAVRAGFQPGPAWTDPDRNFSVHWLQAPSR